MPEIAVRESENASVVSAKGKSAHGARPFLGINFRHFIFGFPSPYDAESQERLIREVKPALAAS